MEILTIVISFIYASTGIVMAFGYIPTMMDLLNKKESANLKTYIIWTTCLGISLIYIILLIPDLLLKIVTGLNFLFCGVILILELRFKYKKV